MSAANATPSAPSSRRGSPGARDASRVASDLVPALEARLRCRALRPRRGVACGMSDHRVQRAERPCPSDRRGRPSACALRWRSWSRHPDRSRREPRAASAGTGLDDRYHARPLTTPRAVRHALVYVLRNSRKHLGVGPELDPCSSAQWFTGWRTPPLVGGIGSRPVARARTWLARLGWRRYGLIGIEEMPKRHQ